MLQVVAKKIFGTRNDRLLKSWRPIVARVNELEASFRPLSDAELKGKTAEFKERLAKGETLDQLLPEAFAAVREASVRTLNMRHFDMQVVGGIVLHNRMISEMRTGEGKTLVATLPAYLNALTGRGVHVVTVNDYLARRDSEWMGKIYNFLGLSVGVVYAGMDRSLKKSAYAADITYGQNNEFGFDYLRDNMCFSADELLQRGHYYAIVDEVDSILIDEARTPLIISGPADDPTDKYYIINRMLPQLKKDEHFEIDLRTKQPTLTEDGVAKSEELLNVENLYDPNNSELLHHIVQALTAYHTKERDVDYVVNDGQVIIVDEFTGRLMPGRRWSNGLHQAIEAKEGLQIAQENQTLASITFQNLFRMYEKLSGMTGTADTEAVEFKQIYNLEVVVIPTNKPMVREDMSDVIFRTRPEKYQAVIDELVEVNKTGQPVLVGTISIEQSEALSRMLRSQGVTHNVLNAKHHEREAEIVAQAGRHGALTISTNMAGRGTDIVLGGNPEFLAQAEANTKDHNDPAYIAAYQKYAAICADEKQKVLSAGGLYIVGTERHEARRIDNQLRGRAGRQGDPGKSRFYVSLEDDLMKRFGGERIQAVMNRLGWEEGVAIDGNLISRSIETAQKKVEAFHFDSRKHVTEYDDVMNKQRQVIYNLRQRVMLHEGVRDEILTMIDDLLEEAVLMVCTADKKPMAWDLNQLNERFTFLFNVPFKLSGDIKLESQAIYDVLRNEARNSLAQHERTQQEKLDQLAQQYQFEGEIAVGHPGRRARVLDFSFENFVHETFLETLDHAWNQHLQDMDHLREGIGLRGYGQKNPLHEYQKEGFLLFQQLIVSVRESIVRKIFFFDSSAYAELLAHIEAEYKRRQEILDKVQLSHGEEASDAADDPDGLNKDPNEQRARLMAQKKARRKARR